MKKTLLVLSAVILLAGCGVNPQKATRALEAQGISDVKIGGYSWFGCSENDTFASNFTGTGANGKRISGQVCSGFFKGVTVRYD